MSSEMGFTIYVPGRKVSFRDVSEIRLVSEIQLVSEASQPGPDAGGSKNFLSGDFIADGLQ